MPIPSGRPVVKKTYGKDFYITWCIEFCVGYIVNRGINTINVSGARN